MAHFVDFECFRSGSLKLFPPFCCEIKMFAAAHSNLVSQATTRSCRLHKLPSWQPCIHVPPSYHPVSTLILWIVWLEGPKVKHFMCQWKLAECAEQWKKKQKKNYPTLMLCSQHGDCCPSAEASAQCRQQQLCPPILQEIPKCWQTQEAGQSQSTWLWCQHGLQGFATLLLGKL